MARWRGRCYESAVRLILALVSTLWLATATASQPSIRVEAGDWGSASAPDIEAVLRSVAEVMLPEFPHQAGVHVVVRASAAGPRVLAVKSANGEHQVLLHVRDTRWDQFAYQFSHELCHIVSNYDERAVSPARSHQWFEEAVCEAVSILTLQRLALRWQQAAPHAGWAPYAPAFAEYAERLMSSHHRYLPGGTSLATWYGQHGDELERDPYLRQKNELIATALLDLFQTAGLQAVGYLNVDTHDAHGFVEYLEAWHDCCPEAHRPLVRRVIELFRT